jgi:hypothetical protein
MPFDLTRRAALAGLLGSVAAPFVVRNSGLLMPVRDRTIPSANELEWQTIMGTRDCRRYPVTVAEVKTWRRSTNDRLARGVMVSWTGEGWARIHRMAEAEKRYKAIGLL